MNLAIPVILFLISLIGLIIASYTDLKNRIVSNKITFSLIALGLIIHAIWSILENNPIIAVLSVSAVIYCFAFSFLLYRLGVWAGGDVKLFTGLAALNPINYFLIGNLLNLKIELLNPINLPLQPFNLFLWSLIAILPYSALITINALRKNKELLSEVKKNVLLRLQTAFYLAFGLIGLERLFEWNGFNNLISLIASLIVITVISLIKKKKIKSALIVLIAVIAISIKKEVLLESIIAGISIFGLYLLIYLFSLSKSKVLKEKIQVQKLEEGMIIDSSYYLEKNQVVEAKAINIKDFINYCLKGKATKILELLKPKGKLIASNKSARGLNENELILLKQLSKKKLLAKEILIKKSAPFAPAILIGFLLSSVLGDLIWHLILRI